MFSIDQIKAWVHGVLDDESIRHKLHAALGDDHKFIDEYNEAESQTDLEMQITTQAEILVHTIITESSQSSATLYLGRRSIDVNQGTVEIDNVHLRLAPGERRALVAGSAGRLRLWIMAEIIPTPVPNRRGQ